MAATTMETVLAIGTRKGLFLLTSKDRKRWRTRGPFFPGVEVHDATIDPKDGKTVWAAVNSNHWGPSIAHSSNLGKKWIREPNQPKYSKESKLSVARIWNAAPGLDDGEVWAGVEPAGLFHTTDDGKSWESMDGFNAWPGREKWMPGGGGLNLHTILTYPGDARRMLVGASSVGVFGSHDRGRSWRLMNGGVENPFSPAKKSKEGEAGSCVHKVVRDARDPSIVYMQNHWGIYRRRRGDEAWTDISRGLPSRFGFPIAAHPHDSGTVFTVPLEGDFNRVTKGGAFAVYRTRNGGKSWQRLTKGLPQKGAWFTVLREGLATDFHDPAGAYVGTTTGQLYASRDDGSSWSRIAEGLPPILSVAANPA